MSEQANDKNPLLKSTLKSTNFEEHCKNLRSLEITLEDSLKRLEAAEEEMKQSAGTEIFQEKVEDFIKSYKECQEYRRAKILYDESKGEILYQFQLGPKTHSRKRLEKNMDAMRDEYQKQSPRTR